MSKSKIRSRKTLVNGIEFDSQTESEYYKHLLTREDVKHIELQPKFILLPTLDIACGRCIVGKVKSPKTGEPINSKTCKGTGQRKRKPGTYTTDLKITRTSGHVSD